MIDNFQSKKLLSMFIIVSLFMMAIYPFGVPQETKAAPLSSILTYQQVSENQKKISSRNYYYMFVKSNGSVASWGNTRTGEPSTPTNLRNVISVTSGRTKSFALRKDGTIAQWGKGDSLSASLAGNDPSKVKDAVAISANLRTLLMVHKNGKVTSYHFEDDGGDSITKIPKDLTNVVDVATGNNHALALKSNGSVVAWGKNYEGNTVVPKGLTNVVAVAAGTVVSVALKKDGTAVAWGQGFNNGDAQKSPYNDVVGISAGFDEVYLLRSDGSVVVWKEGRVTPSVELPKLAAISVFGEEGLLGMTTDGSAVQFGLPNSNYPIPNIAATLIASVSTNDTEYLAVKKDGTLVNWSKFYTPQLSKIPKEATGIIATSLSRNNHVLALKKDKTIIAWGSNTYGEANVPVGLRDVIAVSAGYEYSLALKEDGTVVGWGSKRIGQLDIPEGLNDVVAIAAGAPNLALKKDGTIVAWGYEAKKFPQDLPKSISIMSTDYGLAAALHEDGTITVWNTQNEVVKINATQNTKNSAISISHGYNNELWVLLDKGTAIAFDSVTGFEINRFENKKDFVQVTGNVGIDKNGEVFNLELDNFFDHSILQNLKGVKYLYKNENYLFYVNKDDSLNIQGFDSLLRNKPSSNKDIVKYAFSQYHALALTKQGKVIAWGGGINYRVNPNLSEEVKVPSDLGSIVDIAAGATYSMALTKDGKVKVWGKDQFKIGKDSSNAVNITAIAGADYYVAALKKDGTVVEWGGDQSQRTKMPTGLKNVKAIAISGLNTMALKKDGTVVCWGDDCKTPSNIKNAVSISGAEGHFVIYCSDGTIIDYSTSTSLDHYGHPAKIQNVDKIFALPGATYIRKKDGTSIIWGRGIPYKI